MVNTDELIANNKEMLDRLKQTVESESTLNNEEERKSINNRNTEVDNDGDEDQPQIVVEEGNGEDIDDAVNVVAKDRSYMLSYIV